MFLRRFYFLFLLVFFPNFSVADIPRTINYQGRIVDKMGYPIANGNQIITINLYSNIDDQLAIWSQITTVETKNGYFSIVLGNNPNMPLNLKFDKQYYLGVQLSDGIEMQPRSPLNSVPYALSIADNAVTTNKIADHQITSEKIKDGAINQQKAIFAPSVVVDNLARNNPKIISGTGLTASNGKANINFPSNCFSAPPVVLVSPLRGDNTLFVIVVTNVSVGNFSVQSGWPASNTPAATYFYWAAIGY